MSERRLTTRELAERGGPILSCPVDRRACLREICDVAGERTGWACYHIANEIERRSKLPRAVQ
jgi:hypothetical protein